MSPSQHEKEPVYVVLRADLFQDAGVSPELLVTAKEVVRSQELAEREVARLNALHSDGRVRYWYTPSRLFPPGHSASTFDPMA